MPKAETPAEVARAYIEAWGRHDMETVATYIADDIAYEGPLAQISGSTEYLQLIGGFDKLVTDVEVLAVLGDAQQAMLMYDMTTGPFGKLRAAEHLVVSEGKIRRSKLTFDTYEVRNA